LHGLYWKIFNASKTKGIVEAGEAGEQIEHSLEGADALRERRAAELSAQRAPEPALQRLASNRAPGQRILVCDALMPAYNRASGSKRLFEMLRLLSEAGHAVTFIGRDGDGGEPFARELRDLGVEVYAGDPEKLRMIGRRSDAQPIDFPQLLADSAYDLAILDYWYVAEQYLGDIRRYSPQTRIAIDSVDVH